MNWQLVSDGRHDFDDGSSDSTVRLQVPDSPTDCVQSAWTDHGVHWDSAWTSELGQHHFDNDVGLCQPRSLGASVRRPAYDLVSRNEHVTLSRAVAVDRRGVNDNHGRSLTVNRRRRPSSASSSTSSAGLSITRLFLQYC